MNKSRFSLLAGMILIAALARLLPHPPNFTPVGALAVFGGAAFNSKRAAFLVPLAGMFLSDLVLGFSGITPVVYAAFVLMTGVGMTLREQQTFSRVTLVAAAGAGLFFIVTNLGVWVLDTLYPKTWAGLADCYVAAIPFFRNTLISNLLYSALLFGGLALAEKRFARLRRQPDAVTA